MIDILTAFVQALRASRGGHADAAAAGRRLECLKAAHAAVAAAGEALADLLLAELVAEQEKLLDGIVLRDAQRADDDAKRLAATVAQLAAEHDGHVLAADGGPSDPLTGAAEWVASVESWAAGRR